MHLFYSYIDILEHFTDDETDAFSKFSKVNLFCTPERLALLLISNWSFPVLGFMSLITPTPSLTSVNTDKRVAKDKKYRYYI